MAILTRAYRWEKFHPDLGENLELAPADRLTLEVASGLPPAVLAEWQRALAAAATDAAGVVQTSAQPENEAAREAWAKEAAAKVSAAFLDAVAAAYAPVVRLVGSHSVAGRPVTTLREYLGLVVEETAGHGGYSLTELRNEVVRLNSLGGQQELFFERRSGGSPSTAPRSAAKDSAKTGGR